jgi:hypothetical protein
MRWLLLAAALAAGAVLADETAAPREDLVVSCAIANTLVAARAEAGSPYQIALQERATAYTQLARRSFGVTDQAIAVGLRALNSKVNTGVTRWSDVVAFAEQCPVLPVLAAGGHLTP